MTKNQEPSEALAPKSVSSVEAAMSDVLNPAETGIRVDLLHEIDNVDLASLESRAAFYFAGRFWQRLRFHLQQAVLFAGRHVQNESRHFGDADNFGIPADALERLEESQSKSGSRQLGLAGDRRLQLQQLVPRLAPKFSPNILSRVSAIWESSFVHTRCDDYEECPWYERLLSLVQELRQGVLDGQDRRTQHTRAIRGCRTLVQEFVSQPLDDIQRALLESAAPNEAAALTLGTKFEQGLCPRDVIQSLRKSRWILKPTRRELDLFVVNHELEPGKSPPPPHWAKELSPCLRQCGINDPELHARLDAYATELNPLASRGADIVRDLEQRIMSEFGTTSFPATGAHEKVIGREGLRVRFFDDGKARVLNANGEGVDLAPQETAFMRAFADNQEYSAGKATLAISFVEDLWKGEKAAKIRGTAIGKLRTKLEKHVGFTLATIKNSRYEVFPIPPET